MACSGSGNLHLHAILILIILFEAEQMLDSLEMPRLLRWQECSCHGLQEPKMPFSMPCSLVFWSKNVSSLFWSVDELCFTSSPLRERAIERVYITCLCLPNCPNTCVGRDQAMTVPNYNDMSNSNMLCGFAVPPNPCASLFGSPAQNMNFILISFSLT